MVVTEAHGDAAAHALVSHGANFDKPTQDGHAPVFHCAHHGHASTLQLLIDRGANIDARDGVTVPRSHSHTATLSPSLSHTHLATLTQAQRTPLIWACRAGQQEAATQLVHAGASVNASSTV